MHSNMKSIITIIILFVLIVFSFPALAAQKTVSKDDDDKTVNLNVGDKLVIKLPGNYTTGYQWVVKPGYDAEVIEQSGEGKYKPENTDRVGAPGTAEFTFRAIGAGRTDLELVYIRAWEKDVKPDTDFELTVVVKKPRSKLKKPKVSVPEE